MAKGGRIDVNQSASFDPSINVNRPGSVSDSGIGPNAAPSQGGQSGSAGKLNQIEEEPSHREERPDRGGEQQYREDVAPSEREAAERTAPAQRVEQRTSRPDDILSSMFPKSADRERRAETRSMSELSPQVALDEMMADELDMAASTRDTMANFGVPDRPDMSANSLSDPYESSFVETDIAPVGNIVADRVSGVAGDTVAEVLSETQNYGKVIPARRAQAAPSVPAAPRTPAPPTAPPTAPTATAPAAPSAPAPGARPGDIDLSDLVDPEAAHPSPTDMGGVPGTTAPEPLGKTFGQSIADDEGKLDAALDERSKRVASIPEFHPNANRDLRTPLEKRAEKSRERVAKNISELSKGYFKTSGERKGKNGKTVLSKDVTQAIYDMCTVYDLDQDADADIVYSMVRLYLSLTPDFNGMWFRTEKELVLEDWVFVQAVDAMITNQMVSGWPLKMASQPIKYGNTTCYPSTLIPAEMFARMSSGDMSELHDMEWGDALQIGLDEWKFVRTVMRTNNAPINQIRVIEDFQRAIADMCGIDAEQKMQVPPVEYQTIDEALHVASQAVGTYTDPDLRDAAQAACDAQRSTFDRVVADKVRKGERLHGKRDAVGNFTDSRDVVEHFPETMLRTLTSMSRGLSALDPMLLGSAMLEKVSGTVSHCAASQILFVGNSDFRPTNMAYSAMHDSRVQEMLEGYSAIVATLGQDRLMEFCATGRPPTKENVAEFARPLKKTASGPLVEKMNKLSAWTSGVIGNAMGADWFMRGSDGARFLDNFMLKMAENSRSGMPSMTGEDMAAHLTSDPVSAVVDMMQSMEGQRAFAQMRGRTNGGATILSEPVAQFFRKHGICDSFVSLVVGEKFLVYGIRAAEKWMPMLNTIQLAQKKLSASVQGVDLDEVKRSELLLSRSFKDAVVVDAMNLCTSFGKFVLCMAIIRLLGIEPPDDERKMDMWDEWKIGGTPWREAWYLDDFLTWSMPLAIATCASEKGGDPWKILMDGMSDTLLGLGPFDVAKFILNFDEAAVQSQRVADDPDAIGPDSEMDFYLTSAAVLGVETFGNAIVPRFAREIFRMGIDENSEDHSYQLRYTGKPDEETGELDVERVGYMESELRRATAKNPLLGFLFNVGTGYYMPNTSGEAKTGWMFGDMPISTLSDAMGLYSYQRFNVATVGDDVTVPAVKDERIQEIVDDVIENVIDKFGTTEEVAANGIVIPASTRYYVSSYLYAQMNMIDNEYHARLAIPGEFSDNGLSWEENKARRNDWYNECAARKAEIEKKVDFIWDTKIPADIPKYKRWRTDWQQIYTGPDGRPADEIAYLINKGASMLGMTSDKVTVETVPYGDFRNPVFQQVKDVFKDQETGKSTFDYQTPVVWWSNSLSNWDKISEFVGDAEVPAGMFEGQRVIDVLTMEGQITEGGDWQNVPVIGSRAYVPIDPEKYDFLKPDQDDPNLWTGNTGDEGKKKDWDDDATTSSKPSWGNRRYGRRGGGGGYSPKIYSNPRSINTDRGSTMYTKKPYNAQTSYLRPAVYTKGSREAYRRQDM